MPGEANWTPCPITNRSTCSRTKVLNRASPRSPGAPPAASKGPKTSAVKSKPRISGPAHAPTDVVEPGFAGGVIISLSEISGLGLARQKPLEIGDRLFEALGESDARLPAETFARLRNIGLALLRIVFRQGMED